LNFLNYTSYHLGYLHENGLGCKKDFKQAMESYGNSIHGMYVYDFYDGILKYAECFENGVICKKDLNLAIFYYDFGFTIMMKM
jgi:TPR repeat protein